LGKIDSHGHFSSSYGEISPGEKSVNVLIEMTSYLKATLSGYHFPVKNPSSDSFSALGMEEETKFMFRHTNKKILALT
jgi:hypothetical protein